MQLGRIAGLGFGFGPALLWYSYTPADGSVVMKNSVTGEERPVDSLTPAERDMTADQYRAPLPPPPPPDPYAGNPAYIPASWTEVLNWQAAGGKPVNGQGVFYYSGGAPGGGLVWIDGSPYADFNRTPIDLNRYKFYWGRAVDHSHDDTGLVSMITEGVTGIFTQALPDFGTGLAVIGAGFGLTAGITALVGAGTLATTGALAADLPPSLAVQPFEAGFPEVPAPTIAPEPFEAGFPEAPPQVSTDPFESGFPEPDPLPKNLPNVPPGTTDVLKQVVSAANTAKSVLPILSMGAAAALRANAAANAARPISATMTSANGAPTFGAGLPKANVWASVKPLILPAAIVSGLLYLNS